MADELFFKAITDRREAAVKLSTSKASEVDVWRDVGGVAEEEKQGIRLLAHTKPIEYANLKTKAMTKVREATESSYKSAFEQYVAAGYPIEEAKKHALSAAKQTKDLQKKAMQLLYNDESDIISAKKLVKEADAFKGMV